MTLENVERLLDEAVGVVDRWAPTSVDEKSVREAVRLLLDVARHTIDVGQMARALGIPGGREHALLAFDASLEVNP